MYQTITKTLLVLAAIPSLWVTSNSHADGSGGYLMTSPLPSGAGASSEIVLDPAALSITLAPDATGGVVLSVVNANHAELPLNWEEAAAGTQAVIIDQVYESGASVVSDFFVTNERGVYSADDIDLLGDATIESFYFQGFVRSGSALTDVADTISLYIFADDNGKPSGHPEEETNSALFSLDIAVLDPAIDTTDNDILIDVVAAQGSPISLPAGKYWVSVFPSVNSAYNQGDDWLWRTTEPNNETNGFNIDPSNLFGNGNDWTNLASIAGINASQAGLNYSISTMQTCGASWFSVSPTSGTVAINNNQNVTVMVDATGLVPGVYSAAVCIDSDDTTTPRAVVPLILTVAESNDLIFADGFE